METMEKLNRVLGAEDASTFSAKANLANISSLLDRFDDGGSICNLLLRIIRNFLNRLLGKIWSGGL